jgi:hypothetical protein
MAGNGLLTARLNQGHVRIKNEKSSFFSFIKYFSSAFAGKLSEKNNRFGFDPG